MMFLDPAMEYRWISVGCDTQFENMFFVCEQKRIRFSNRFIMTRSIEECSPREVFVDHMCFRLKRTCNIESVSVNRITHATSLLISSWIRGRSDNLLEISRTYMSSKRTCVRSDLNKTTYLNNWNILNKCPKEKSRYSLCVHNFKRPYVMFCYNYFQCVDGECIQQSKVCNGHADCKDKSDEYRDMCIKLGIFTSTECTLYQFVCHFIHQCISLEKICDQFVDCEDMTDEIYCSNSPTYSFFKGTHYKLPMQVENNEAVVVNGLECPDSYAHCNLYSNECYNNHLKCIFDRYITGEHKHCSNDEHLQFCFSFQCSSAFKCLRSYCVPLYLVCDGIADCPNSEDEFECKHIACPGFLRCPLEDLCIHWFNVCDGIVHCLMSRDDERTCDFEASNEKCRKVGDSTACKNDYIGDEDASYLRKQRSLIFVNCTVCLGRDISRKSGEFTAIVIVSTHLCIDFLWNEHFIMSGYLRVLIILNAGLRGLKLNVFKGLFFLRILDLRYNHIHNLKPNQFNGLLSIEIINLAESKIEKIYNGAFSNLWTLKKLNLSYNKIVEVHEYTFSGPVSLTHLDISMNPFRKLDFSSFRQFQFKTDIITSSIAHCCYVHMYTKLTCYPSKSTKSCYVIFTGILQRVLLWMYCIVIAVINLGAFIIHFNKAQHKAHFLIVEHIIIGDSFVLVYFINLLTTEELQNESFLIFSETFSYTIKCHLMIASISISQFISLFMTMLKAVDTLLLTRYAMVQQPLSHMSIVIWSIIAWASIILSQFQFINGANHNTLCLGFVLNSIEITVLSFYIIINATMLFITGSCLIYIIRFIKSSQDKFGKTISTKQRLTIKSLTIRFTQTLTLYTFDFVFHLSLQLDCLQFYIPNLSLQIWIVTTFFVLKSIMNPILHTFIMTSTFKAIGKKIGHKL